MKELMEFLRSIKEISGWFALSVIITIPVGILLFGRGATIFVVYVIVGFYLLIFLLMAYGHIKSKNLRNGPLVIGTIVSAEEIVTDSSLFLDLTIQFYTLDGRQVTASERISFSRNMWKLFQIGELYPLRYHPENPEEIMTSMEGVSEEALERAFDIYSEKVKNGKLVVGTIVSVKKHTVYVNNSPVFSITVQFSTADGQEITAFDRRVISDDKVSQLMLFQTGEIVALRYDPENPEQIMLAPEEMKKTLEHDRAKRREKVKNGPLVFGIVALEESTDWRIGDMNISDITIYFKTIDEQQMICAHQRILHAESQLDSLIPLRYNPENPQQIELANDEDEATLQQALDAQRIASGQVTQEEVNMIRNGVKATGVILFAQPTGNIINGNGEMALQVKVTRPDGETYEVTINRALSQDDLSSAKSGKEIEVFYMPENEENITIVL